MTTQAEKDAVLAAVQDALTAQFATKTIDAETRAYLLGTGATDPTGVTAASLAGDLDAAITVDE
jgi:hypothetical protein